jgi:Peptidase family M1 domain
LCGYSCGVPLAPGYRTLRETDQVHFVSGNPPELRIAADYRLENSGTTDLTFIDAVLPSEKSFGRRDLRVTVDGLQIKPVALPVAAEQPPGDIIRISFDPPWANKKIHDISVGYAFRSPTNWGPRITLGDNDFHLGSQGWLPKFQPPKHLLAPNPGRPTRMEYTIRVPSDFVVLARGAPKGQKREGGEIAYRFELFKDDLPPYIVAGKYIQWPARQHSQSAVFWTAQALKDDHASAVEEITSAWHTLETTFGPLDKNIAGPHIVESPQLQGHLEGEHGPAAAAFSGGAIVNPAALELGIDSAQFLDIVTHALAHNWFGDEMAPSPDSALGIGEGLPEYATIVIEEARNGPAARRTRILQYLRKYEEARNGADETPLGFTMFTDPPAQRRIALAKAPLFFIELEDICGEAPMRSGLAHLVALLRGQEVGYDDLRAALEETTNRNLAKPFRVWLNGKGIPQDFLDRYPYPLAPTTLETGQ